MTPFEKLLLENKAWSHERTEEDPEYFHKLAQLQTPEFLWIGCSDSRVPANEITNTQPGEIFVHRNISNLVIHTDVNLLSVLDFAVNHLKVNHVIVCGHYGCGGVKAAMSNHNYDLVLNMWLRNIKDVYRLYEAELTAIEDEEKRTDRLVELNVKEQVLKLAKTSIIQKAWKTRNAPKLHGWAYGLKDGIIKDLFNLEPGDFSSITPIYQYDDL
jgi:carbonic anhydrase